MKFFLGSISQLLFIFVSVYVTLISSSAPQQNTPTMSGVTQGLANTKSSSTNDLGYLSSLGLHIHEYPNDDFSHILGAAIPVDERNAYAPSKLQQICKLRLDDVATKKGRSSSKTGDCDADVVTADQYMQHISEFDRTYGSPLNLQERIAVDAMDMAIAAEFKKSSPSKGDINIDVDPVNQCLEYAKGGVSVISVLTEYTHFKGTLDDMRAVRLATQQWSSLNSVRRPAILRKDFILDKYQILEARANGADTVLLIVAVLGVQQLSDLIVFCRELGIEPLVEVHTKEEVDIALQCGATCMGVNNRNLHTFKLDLDTTKYAIEAVKKAGKTWLPSSSSQQQPDVTIAALSGIAVREDVMSFKDIGVSCCLVGETLMKSNNPARTISDLLGVAESSSEQETIIKICGMTNEDEVKEALTDGVDLIGLIFAKSTRSVSQEEAKKIVDVVRRYGERDRRISLDKEISMVMGDIDKREDESNCKYWYRMMATYIKGVTRRTPLTVGVFQDQSVEEINEIIKSTGIDVVQLHGQEGLKEMEQINAPCIKVLHIDAPEENGKSSSDKSIIDEANKYISKAVAILLDTKVGGSSASGGTGVTFDWGLVERIDIPVILAGGLHEGNVLDALMVKGVIGVDASSGLEVSAGRKDMNKVKNYASKIRKFS